ncbi:MAG: LarC family nickel insertion protein, partial [SAR202 cluster bacterium]|nr:LarC family nickel insertion protein [SAR202 cluster bacterium]
MTTAYFNLIGGLSGDMLLSSLFDSGLDQHKLHNELKKIDDIDFNFDLKDAKKHNINGTHTEVVILDSIKWNWKAFYKSINNSKLSKSVIDRTIECFDLLKEAEESAHDEKNPHLHELGTSDTIIDICGFFIGIDLLGITDIICSSIPVT